MFTSSRYKNSKLAPVLNWLDFERESFYKHKIFSTPKINDDGKIFAIQNNLEQSFDNGFHKDAIFVIFANYNIEKSKHVLFQQDKN